MFLTFYAIHLRIYMAAATFEIALETEIITINMGK